MIRALMGEAVDTALKLRSLLNTNSLWSYFGDQITYDVFFEKISLRFETFPYNATIVALFGRNE